MSPENASYDQELGSITSDCNSSRVKTIEPSNPNTLYGTIYPLSAPKHSSDGHHNSSYQDRTWVAPVVTVTKLSSL